MSEPTPETGSQPGGQGYGQQTAGTWQPPAPGPGQPPIPTQAGQLQPSAPYGYPPVPAGAGSIGQVRSTGTCMLLFFCTLGIYGLVWYFKVHEEMKRHSGSGLGGPLALVLAFFIGVASPFLTSSEIGLLYERRGQAKPVSGATGLWYIPGIFILVGPFIWFAKTNAAINDYWASLGATR